MPLYEIPLWMRFVGMPWLVLSKVKCLSIDEVGMFVYYEDEKELEIESLRRRLTFRRKTRCLVEAESPEEAVGKFYSEWEGARIGGEDPESKALWINAEEPILEFPDCEHRGKNSHGQFICGELEEDFQVGKFGMCMLEGYDAPFEDCPIHQFYQTMSKRRIN